MSEQYETSSEDGGERGVAVRRLAPAGGLRVHQIVRAVRATLADHPLKSLSVALVDDAVIARLHAEYMNDPSPTDVLSFDLREDAPAEPIDGEVVVSTETARRQAERRGLAHQEEILRYVIHGVLHLMGHDDATPRERAQMRRAENRVLAGLKAGPGGARAAAQRRSVSPGRRDGA